MVGRSGFERSLIAEDRTPVRTLPPQKRYICSRLPTCPQRNFRTNPTTCKSMQGLLCFGGTVEATTSRQYITDVGAFSSFGLAAASTKCMCKSSGRGRDRDTRRSLVKRDPEHNKRFFRVAPSFWLDDRWGFVLFASLGFSHTATTAKHIMTNRELKDLWPSLCRLFHQLLLSQTHNHICVT